MRTLCPIMLAAVSVMTACGPQVTVNTSADLNLDGATHLVVKTAGGHIFVSPGPADTLHVDVARRASTEGEARALVVDIEASGDVATVEWNGAEIGDASVSFAILAPPSLLLNAQTGGGDIRVDGSTADATLSTGGGMIDVRNGQGSLTAHSGGGPITITNQVGSLMVQTDGGNIETFGVRGTLNAITNGGSIFAHQQDGTVTAQASAGSIAIDGVLRGANSVHTSGGNVDVTVPGTSRLVVSAQTEAGDAANDFGLPVLSSLGPEQSFSGQIGDGRDGTIDLRTSAGSIDLHRSN